MMKNIHNIIMRNWLHKNIILVDKIRHKQTPSDIPTHRLSNSTMRTITD